MQDTPSLNSQKTVSSSTTFPYNKANKFQHASHIHRPSKKRDSSKCFFLTLPGESLTHITTYVDDPASLFALSRVNRQLRDHIADDNTWYRVFAFHFLGIGPESDPNEEQKILVRRTESTWKKEFVQRFKAICRWEKSRTSALRYQPHYWDVFGMHLLENLSLMTSNLQYGIVTRSFPLTGKILKGHLDASGTANGFGIGNPNEEFSPNVSCVALSSCGGTGRIAWGFRNGEVAVTFAPRVMDSNRPAARFTRCSVDDAHTGDVRCLTFTGREDELIASGCSHGQVKLWDARRMLCLWTGFGPKGDTLLPDPCVKVGYCVGANVVAAAFQGGDIMIWWGFQLQDDGAGGHIERCAAQALRVAQPVNHTSTDVSAIESLYFDPSSSPSKVKLLVLHTNERHFLRLQVDLQSGLVILSAFCGGLIGPLTSIKPCFGVHKQDSAGPPTPLGPPTPSLTTSNTPDLVVSHGSSFVLGGDSLGRVSLWNWNADGLVEKHDDVSATDRLIQEINSCRRWEAHDDGAVSAIEVSDLVIVTGSSRGTLKVWDSLTFSLLRSFASPAVKPSPTGQWDPVGQIILRGDLLVANVGSRILVWQAGTVVADKKGKIKNTGKPRGRGVGSTLNKWQQQIELNRDISESKRLLEDERKHAQRVHGRARAQRATLNQLGLSETEAVQYVMMLSRDEENERAASILDGASSSVPDPTMETSPVVPSDDADGVFTLDGVGEFSRLQPPVQAQASGTSHTPPSASWHHGHSQSVPPTSHSNGALSPSSSPPLSESGISGSPCHSSTTTSTDPMQISMDARCKSGTSISTGTTGSSLDDPEAFPLMRPSLDSSNRSTTSLQLSGSWSRGSISSSIRSRQEIFNPTHNNDTSPPTSSFTPSPLLTPAIPSRDGPRSRAVDEDDELRFVLELSLAEARSRGEV